ncbi:FAD-binding domain-containing protein [Thozetella sp. PMI_491]|nr:FAD-binding domain-containing protein [Thozetella sp. PMI_491]
MRTSQAKIFSLLFFSRGGWGVSQECKCVPGDPCWPGDHDLDALNQTVSCRLLKGVPPASVCYPEEPNYNPSACQTVRDSWFSSTFHASNPISIGWPWWANNTCPPIFPNGTSVTGDPDAGKKGCSLGGYPAYALNATDPSHIQAVVKFANEWNIRLNIKSTGHSFQGRSTAFGSLSIWTHNFRGASWHDNFEPENCPGHCVEMAATFAAGERSRNVYEFAAQHNAVIVAGSAQDVGIVGWFTGGGHGPLTATYGMGADNVLQVKIVTPTGDFITANACQNPDIFWAVRGGGGGTYGIITEVTLRAYPSPPTASHNLRVSPLLKKNKDDFIAILARIFSELPRLKEGGMQGYIGVDAVDGDGGGEEGLTLTWGLTLYNKSEAKVRDLFAPIGAFLTPLNGSVIFCEWSTNSAPNFFAMWNATIGDEPVAVGGGALSSRLLPAEVLTDQTLFSKTLQKLLLPGPGGATNASRGLLAALVANSDQRNNNISMNSAWRDAVVHFIITGGFPDWYDYNEASPILLRSLAPHSGAYFNEGDPYEPQSATDFFGASVSRLELVKKKYDPNSVLWCLACIGSGTWVEVSQPSGRLCKAH